MRDLRPPVVFSISSESACAAEGSKIGARHHPRTEFARAGLLLDGPVREMGLAIRIAIKITIQVTIKIGVGMGRVRGCKIGGEVAGVAPGEGVEAEIKDAVEFVEGGANVKPCFSWGQLWGAGGFFDGDVVGADPADDWG